MGAIETLRLDAITRLDPEREMRLSQFIDNPVDSRDPFQLPAVPFQSPSNTRVRIPIFEPYKIEKYWAERFSDMSFNSGHRHYHRHSPSYPTLRQRQRLSMGDPLHSLDVEAVSVLRSVNVQGPAQQLAALPKHRCLPRNLVSKHLLHGRIIP
jgi:hypothetical protein